MCHNLIQKELYQHASDTHQHSCIGSSLPCLNLCLLKSFQPWGLSDLLFLLCEPSAYVSITDELYNILYTNAAEPLTDAELISLEFTRIISIFIRSNLYHKFLYDLRLESILLCYLETVRCRVFYCYYLDHKQKISDVFCMCLILMGYQNLLTPLMPALPLIATYYLISCTVLQI